MNFYNVSLFKSCYLKSQLFVSDKKEIVFVGRSNVGKSSLINRLCGRRKLARVSNVPGKTISINFYSAGNIYLVDFPGYGFAKIAKFKRKVWDDLAQGYFSSKRNIVFCVVVIDCRRGCKELDFDMVRYLVYNKLYFVIVLSKADKLKERELQSVFEATKKDFSFLKNLKVILFSSKTGQGEKELKQVVERFCNA